MRRPRWLLVGALAAETLPVLGRVRGARMLSPRLAFGSLAGVEVALLTCGVGPERAARRTQEALALLEPQQVLSFGTCGSLRDELPVGSVVSPGPLLREGEPAGELPRFLGARPARLTTVGAAVDSPGRRAALAAFADVCEMEAVGVHAAAGERPFQALKVVSDLAGGDPADVALSGRPVGLVRFQARALRLVERALLPVLLRGLTG